MTKAYPSLKAMAEDKDFAGASKVTSFALDPRIIKKSKPGVNRPIDPAHVRALADAYKRGAIFPPLEVSVENGEAEVVDGQHRHEAALLAISEGAEIRSIECRQFRGNDADKVFVQISSQDGLKMTPLIIGGRYKLLIGWGWTVAQIAERAGKSGQHVKDCIALAETNTDVQKLVQSGKVSAKVALATAKKHGGDAGKVLKEDLKKAEAAGKAKVTNKTASAKAMTLLDAIRREIETNGAEKAHLLAPQYEREIQYLRATGL